MYLGKALAKNFMGAETVEQVFGKLTLITGKNMTGKTRLHRIAQTILAGYIPEYGRKPGRFVERIGNGKEVRVRGLIDGGPQVTRRFFPTEKGASQESSPADWAIPAIMVDVNEYIALDPKERLEFLFSVVKLEEGDFSLDALTAALKAIKVETPTKESEKAISEIVQEVTRRHGFIGKDTPLDKKLIRNVNDYVNSVVEYLEERRKTAKAAVDRMDGTVKGLIEMASTAEPAPIHGVETELAAAHAKLVESSAALESLVKSERTDKTRSDRKKFLQDEIAKDSGERPSYTSQIAKLEKLASGWEKADMAVDDAKAENVEAQKKLSALEATHAANVARIEDANKTHAKNMKCKTCPVCEAEGGDFQARLEKMHKRAVDPLNKENEKIAAQIVAEKKRIKEIAKKCQQAIDVYAELTQAKQSLEDLRAKEKEFAASAQRFADMRAELATMADVVTGSRADAITKAQAAKDEAAKAHAELQTQDNANRQAKNEAASQAKAMEEGRRYLAGYEVAKAALVVALQTRAALIKGAISSLLNVANMLARPILGRRLDYQNDEIGSLNGTDWQGHHTFSGMEQAISYAAISIALAQQSPVRIVMIDEMGILDPECRCKLLALAKTLMDAGKLDQFICNDTETEPYKTLDADTLGALTHIKL